MAFVCPECLTPGALHITASLQLPADSRSDDIALQIVECANCQFEGIAVYEESRRGALDAEAWEHTGYRVRSESVQRLREAVRQCPAPSDTDCQCPIHRQIGRADPRGRWQGLDDLETLDAFPMRLVRE